MNLDQSHTNSHESARAETHLHGRWLFIARAGWVALTLLVLTLNAIAIPHASALMLAICQPGTLCINGWTPAEVSQMQQFGLSPGLLAAYQIGWDVGTTLIYTALATLIFWRQSFDRMALFCAYMLVLFGGATYTGLLDLGLRTVSPAWFWLVGGLELLAQVCVPTFFLLFPSGRFVPRWSRWGVLIFVLGFVWYIFLTNAYLGQFSRAIALVFAALLLGLVGLQVYRYRRVSIYRERQQTKWVVFGLAMAFGGFALFLIVANLFLPPDLLNSPVATALIPTTVGDGLLLFIPISISIAILRYRLWDIDILINRTVVYGTLTACVIALYVLVVVGLGALLQTSGNLLISLLATGLVAVLFQPLRERLQRAVNRMMYGERDTPYRVISRLGQRLEATLVPDAVLPMIVETVTQALRLPYAAISLKQDGEDVITASSGRAADELTRLPLVYQSEHIGDLLLAPRARGETFSSADQTLLADLARQAGIAVHAVLLTTDLQRLTKELQHSRTHLVTTREEERRRLRRDLHDGLGSVLASLNWRAGALRLVLFRDPVAADALVVEQQNTIQAAIGDIRRLVYDLRPPALDELGLIGAICERAAQQYTPTEHDSFQGLRVDVVAPDQLPVLPAAVEVAAYRIVQEALANVVRHAHAQRCCICLSCENDLLHVEISDDGVGLPESYRAGVGLLSLHERAAELGGTCEIVQMPEGGTCVRACLPLLKHDQQR